MEFTHKLNQFSHVGWISWQLVIIRGQAWARLSYGSGTRRSTVSSWESHGSTSWPRTMLMCKHTIVSVKTYARRKVWNPTFRFVFSPSIPLLSSSLLSLHKLSVPPISVFAMVGCTEVRYTLELRYNEILILSHHWIWMWTYMCYNQ